MTGRNRLAAGFAALAVSSLVALLAVAPASAAWTPGVDVARAKPPDVTATDVEVAPDGSAVFIWDRAGALDTRVRAPNGTFSAVRRITPRGSLGQYGDFEVAVDSEGTAYYVWGVGGIQGRQVRTRVRYADGTLGPVRTLATAAGTANDYLNEVDVGVDASGRAVFSWVRYQPHQASLQARTRSPGGQLGPTLDVGSGAYHGMTVTPAGRAIFGWQARAGYLARVLSPTGTLGPQLRVSASGNDGQVASGGENVVFDWKQPGPGNDWRIMTREWSPGGSLSPPQVITQGNVTSSAGGEGLIAIAPDGTAAYYWWASGRAGARIRSPSGTLGPIENVFGDIHGDTGLEVVGDASADFVFLLGNAPGAGNKQTAMVRTHSAGGGWGPVHVLTPPGYNAYSARVAINAAGDGAATWYEGKHGFAVQGAFGP